MAHGIKAAAVFECREALVLRQRAGLQLAPDGTNARSTLLVEQEQIEAGVLP